MATETGMIIEQTQEQRIRPLAMVQQDSQRAVMEIKMPQGVNLLAFVTADFALLEAPFFDQNFPFFTEATRNEFCFSFSR
ncbi:MAG: hypothetical protein HY360_06165 [Verrucomicrobia bacterium]|nr:hypothetical protein [Verrucomicrobiota bacterium]